MKKTIFLTIILTLLLAACGGSAKTDTNTENDEQFVPTSIELPLSSTLAIGTLKLEGTDQAIASDQAINLLPLWQVLNSLTDSDTAAPEEVEAILEQIQETMTDEQMAAIKAMELTREDIFATLQELGVTTRQPNAEGDSPSAGGFSGGQGPGGGVPGGGGGPGGQEISPEQIATAQARRAEDSGGFGNRLVTPLVEAVIELLEAKVQ